ncbi:MED1 [Mytilus edulis]|uniref:MED1 n=1 Tax=Mytilus edulis TaxID=6550 RepID=A0A8S3SUT2_MYTED|nr:MED1 [Mytilus edulis]
MEHFDKVLLDKIPVLKECQGKRNSKATCKRNVSTTKHPYHRENQVSFESSGLATSSMTPNGHMCTDKFRLQGSKINPDMLNEGKKYGTVGMFLEDEKGTYFFTTCAHVIGENNEAYSYADKATIGRNVLTRSTDANTPGPNSEVPALDFSLVQVSPDKTLTCTFGLKTQVGNFVNMQIFRGDPLDVRHRYIYKWGASKPNMQVGRCTGCTYDGTFIFLQVDTINFAKPGDSGSIICIGRRRSSRTKNRKSHPKQSSESLPNPNAHKFINTNNHESQPEPEPMANISFDEGAEQIFITDLLNLKPHKKEYNKPSISPTTQILKCDLYKDNVHTRVDKEEAVLNVFAEPRKLMTKQDSVKDHGSIIVINVQLSYEGKPFDYDSEINILDIRLKPKSDRFTFTKQNEDHMDIDLSQATIMTMEKFYKNRMSGLETERMNVILHIGLFSLTLHY